MSTKLAVIPCRAGSVRLPNKNVGVMLCGKLLFEWTAEAALASGVFDKVVVISNGEKVLERAAEMDGITVMEQPFEVAHPTATSESVMEYVISELAQQGEKFDLVALLQITSPLRDAEDIQEAFEGLERAGGDTCISACLDVGFHWDRWTGFPLDFDDGDRPPTSERTNRVRENGAIYITGCETLKQTMSRINGINLYFHVMPEWKDVDIDTAEELQTAEWIMRASRNGGGE